MTGECLTLDDLQYSRLPEGERNSWNWQPKLCNNGKFHWTMVVNGTQAAFDPAYVFSDEDQILLSYSSSDTTWQQQWQKMTDDACRYSLTCPARGTPPKEDCIADPTVPCME